LQRDPEQRAGSFLRARGSEGTWKILALLHAGLTLLRVIPTLTRKQAFITVTFPDRSDLRAVSEPLE